MNRRRNHRERAALVTGASSGLGEEFARQLAAQGYNLVIVARRGSRLQSLATALYATRVVNVEVLQADLTAGEGVALVEERLRRGDIDLLVNNAGVGTVGEFARLPARRELEQVDLNVRAVVALTHAALGPMIARGGGGVINVASMAAYEPVPYNATYAATKAFVLHFSEAIHEEVRAQGVIVTCLCPGPVRTEFQQVAGIDGKRMGGRPLLHFMARAGVDTVVRAALTAHAQRRAVCVPGVLNTAIVATVRTAPEVVVRRLAGAAFRGQAAQDGE
jgi:short-subunit dehydrogenase